MFPPLPDSSPDKYKKTTGFYHRLFLLYYSAAATFLATTSREVEEKYFIYDNDTLDITDIVRESILAELPQKVLCKDDCRGLCPKCGKNLNQGQCDCDLHEVDPRLAILAKLKEAEEV